MTATIPERVEKFHDKFPSRNPDVKSQVTDWLTATLTETDQQARESVAQKIQIIIDSPVTPEDIPPFPSTESSKSAREGFLTGVAWQAVQVRNALSNPPSQV